MQSAVPTATSAVVAATARQSRGRTGTGGIADRRDRAVATRGARRRVGSAAIAGGEAAVADSQSVKTSGNVPEASQGIDAGKKIKGRKRHIVTDMMFFCW
jgi:hypothetical protein